MMDWRDIPEDKQGRIVRALALEVMDGKVLKWGFSNEVRWLELMDFCHGEHGNLREILFGTKSVEQVKEEAQEWVDSEIREALDDWQTEPCGYGWVDLLKMVEE